MHPAIQTKRRAADGDPEERGYCLLPVAASCRWSTSVSTAGTRMRLVSFVMAFAPCLRAQATYESLMLRYARASSSTRRCIEAQARQPPHSLPPGPFWTIGVEGAGHHMVEAMHPSLCNGHGFSNGSKNNPNKCGGQMSFPSGRAWRLSAAISPSSQEKSCASLLAAGSAGARKYIFLLRDPVDATISTLGRFWNHKKQRNDTLMAELAAARMGWRHVVECLRALPCERSLIMSHSAVDPNPHPPSPQP